MMCYTATGDFSKVPEYVCHFSVKTVRLTEIKAERLENNYENKTRCCLEMCCR